MATGDLANNLRKLQKEIKLIKYSDNVDLAGMSQGTPTAFLPIYHYLFTSYSHSIAELISASDTELFGKTDFRFVEAVYKLMRDMFSYKPPVTKEQFFNAGFAERKIIMCADVIQMIREKNRSLQPTKKSSTSAVSTISHGLSKKSTRPKTADLTRPIPQPTQVRPGSADQKQVKFAEEVVNELRQPPKQETSRHVAHKDPPSPVTIVNMSPVVTKEKVKMDDHPSRGFKYAVVTPAVGKCQGRSARSGENGANKGLNFDTSGDIEVVTAITPDTSLYEPLHSTGIVHDEFSNQISTLQQTVSDITQRLSGFETAMSSITRLMEDRPTPADPHQLVVGIQQQIENLTARMILIENRVSIIESNVQTSTLSQQSSNTVPVNGHDSQNSHRQSKEYNPQTSYPNSASDNLHLKNGLSSYSRTTSSSGPIKSPHSSNARPTETFRPTEAPPTETFRPSDVRPTEKFCPSDVRPTEKFCPSNVRPTEVSHPTREDYDKQGTKFRQTREVSGTKSKDFVKGTSLSDNNDNIIKPSEEVYKHPSYHHDNQAIPSHLSNMDQFSFALSPIRTIKDTNGSKLGCSTTGEDTFAMEGEDDDKRRSSTPTDFKDLPLQQACEDSLSFQCGDVSMQQRVDRIKNMMVSTKSMLNQ